MLGIGRRSGTGYLSPGGQLLFDFESSTGKLGQAAAGACNRLKETKEKFHLPGTGVPAARPGNAGRGRVVLKVMRKFLVALTALGIAWGANLKLYMTDGSYQLVREYKVQGDRVRFYSIERSDWEEIPKSLVDWKRTETESAARQAEIEKETKILSEEDKAERELQKEVMRIPQDPGVYWLDGPELHILKAADQVVHTNKGREWLKVLAPMPVVSGKGTLEIQNPHSVNIITNPEQEFYIQLSATEQFGIAKLTPKNQFRVVEDLTFMPVTKETVEQPYLVDILQKQMTDNGLYKIWPKEPLPPGEYAVIEYTSGKMNMQVWDFAVKPASKK